MHLYFVPFRGNVLKLHTQVRQRSVQFGGKDPVVVMNDEAILVVRQDSLFAIAEASRRRWDEQWYLSESIDTRHAP